MSASAPTMGHNSRSIPPLSLNPTSPNMTASSPPPIAAAPPSRSEIERKLSFKGTGPKTHVSPRKKRTPSNSGGGTDSDSSHNPGSPTLGASSGSIGVVAGIGGIGSPIPLTGNITSTMSGGSLPTKLPLMAIAERKSRAGAGVAAGAQTPREEEFEEEEELDVEGGEAGDEEASGSEDEGGTGGVVKAGGDKELERGMEGERVLKSGYLWKKQEKRKVWKKKWFVLRTGKLAYYKDDREYSLSRVIDLHQVHTVATVKVKKQSFVFGIVTSKRTFLARASSQEEMDTWVNAINNARRKLSEDDKAAASGVVVAAGPTTAPSKIDTAGAQATYVPSGIISASPVLGSTTNNSNTRGAIPMSAPPGGGGGSSMDNDTIEGRLAQMSLPSPGLGIGQSPNINTSNSGISRGFQPRREPSASSLGSSIGHSQTASTGEYFPRQISGSGSIPAGAGQGATTAPLSPIPHSGIISSDEDEHEQDQYFTDPMQALGNTSMISTSTAMYPQLSGTVDPKKIILASYLMKRSKGRGRKVWRKRWFFLTSQGLTYTKSHMDSKPLRYIPLSSILDALDLEPSSGLSSDPDSEDEITNPMGRSTSMISSTTGGGGGGTRSISTSSYGTSAATNIPESGRSPPQRQLSHLGTSFTSSLGVGSSSHHHHYHKNKDGHKDKDHQKGSVDEEHTFRLVTAKRTYVLCAPSEEDEIKWLAAFRALLQRERSGGVPASPTMEYAPNTQSRYLSTPGLASGAPGGIGAMGTVPMITQQPPTPSLQAPSVVAGLGLGDPIPSFSSSSTSKSLVQQQEQPQPQPQSPQKIFGNRGRSPTYTAKSAVEAVVRRYHPERERKEQENKEIVQ